MQKTLKSDHFWKIALLIGLTVITYWASLWYGFIFDDLPQITQNHYLKVLSLKDLFFGFSRWISTLLNGLTIQWWGLNPCAFRTVNLALQCINGLLVYYVTFQALRTKNSAWWQKHAASISFFTTALFLLHPLQTQTATYIIQMRLEGLVLFFILTMIALLIAYSRSTTINRQLFYSILITLTALLSAGTKEIIIVLPLLVLLYDWFCIAQGNVTQLKQRLIIHALVALAVWGTFFGYTKPFSPTQVLSMSVSLPNNRGNVLTGNAAEKISSTRYFMSQFKVIAHYLIIFFVPIGLSFDYDYTLSRSLADSTVLIPLLLLLLLLAWTAVRFWRDQQDLVSFIVGWFFMSILPRASIVPSTELVCDYKTYIASPAIMALIAYLMVRGYEKAEPFVSTMIPALHRSLFISSCLLAALSFSSYWRNTVWSSPLLFWGDVIAKAPHKARAHNNYAVALSELGRKEEAIESFKESIRCDAYYAEPIINLALHYQLANEDDKAFTLYQHAMTINEPHALMYNNLGMLHMKREAYDKALQSFDIAVAMNPFYTRAHTNRARVLLALNQKEKALESLEKAISSTEELVEALRMHAELAQQLGHHDRALISLARIMKFDPSVPTLFRMGVNLYGLGNFTAAADYFQQAYALLPTDRALCYNYGQTLMRLGRFNQALSLMAQCPAAQFPFAPVHTAYCLAQLAHTDKAIALVKDILANSPGPVKAAARDLITSCKLSV